MEAAGFSEVGNYLPNFMVLNPSRMLPSVDHGQKLSNLFQLTTIILIHFQS